MDSNKNEVANGKVLCPKCKAQVDDVDGEFRRHYVVANLVCTMSKREIDYKEQP